MRGVLHLCAKPYGLAAVLAASTLAVVLVLAFGHSAPAEPRAPASAVKHFDPLP